MEVPYEIKDGILIKSLTGRKAFIPEGPVAPGSKIRALSHAKIIGKGKTVIWDMIVLWDKYLSADLDNVRYILEVKFNGDTFTENQKKALRTNAWMKGKLLLVEEKDCACKNSEEVTVNDTVYLLTLYLFYLKMKGNNFGKGLNPVPDYKQTPIAPPWYLILL